MIVKINNWAYQEYWPTLFAPENLSESEDHAREDPEGDRKLVDSPETAAKSDRSNLKTNLRIWISV